MARSTLPQKTLSLEDRALFDRMIEQIRPMVGVHLNQPPRNIGIDTRIMTNLTQYPVRRPPASGAIWSNYYSYLPTYGALTPELRWSYIAWLLGDEAVGLQLFRQMRAYSLSVELGGPRHDEAVAALRDLYGRPATDPVSKTLLGNILTMAYAISDPAALPGLLAEHDPSGLPLDIVVRCLARADIEAPGSILFEIARRCNVQVARGLSNRRPLIEQTMAEIAARWSERNASTVVRYVVDHTPSLAPVMGYTDTIIGRLPHLLGLETGRFIFEKSEAALLMRGLAAAAQEQVRSQRKGSEAIDGFALLESMLCGDSTAAIQFDLSGSADHEMSAAERQALRAKIERVRRLAGVKIVAQEWDVYGHWDQGVHWAPDGVIIETLPIKTPASPQPWPAPNPPTFASSSYKALTPEQRWWYLDWLAGEPLEPLDVFLALRYKGLAAAYGRKPDQHLLAEIEALFERATDEALGRAALEIILPAYAELGDGERASQLFNRTPISPEQVPRLLASLWAAGGELDGRGLLNVARAGDFNHTPLTREYFEPIAERAAELMGQWEAEQGPLSDLPVVLFSRARRKGATSAIQVAAMLARQAQEDFKAQRRAAPRTARMSAEELAAEQVELADLPANAGDGPSDAVYRQLHADPDLTGVYLAQGVAALERGQAAVAVAFLRRAAELAPESAAARLLPLARLRLDEWQRQHSEGG